MKGILTLSMVLALVAVLVTPLAALADSDTTVVFGSVVEGIEVTAPAGTDLGIMYPGQTTEGDLKQGSVWATGPWTMNASDNKIDNDGYMVDTDSGPLDTMLEISGDGTTFHYADTGLEYAGGAGTAPFNFYARQYVTYDDPVDDNYNIIITFTATLVP